MTPLHKHIRDVVQALRRLHGRGLTKVRFMLETSEDNYQTWIGAMRYFARKDGLFIPADVRHRTVLLEPGAPMPSDSDLIQELRARATFGHAPQAQDLLGVKAAIVTPVQDGLDGYDYSYVRWFESLAQFLEKYEWSLPLRVESEHLDKHSQSLRIAFLQKSDGKPLAPEFAFPAPPPGVLNAEPPRVTDPDVQVAQPRDTDAPNLLWDARSGPTWDQTIDDLSDNR